MPRTLLLAWPGRLSSLLLGESNRLSISDSEVEGAENGMREKLHCTLLLC